jgi:Tfp pilus assembly protein PilF
VAGYREALRLAPGLAAAHTNLGSTLQALGDVAGSCRAFREAVRLEPNSAVAHQNLGAVLREAREYAASRAALLRAIELDPTYAPSHYNLGVTLVQLDEHDLARRSLLEALRLRPRYAHPYCSLGGISLARGDYDEALANFERALAIDPELAEAHFNRGTLLLSRGDFSGWSGYEWRLRVRRGARPVCGPAWDGQPLGGRTILLFAEQGFGDSLQFIRYAPLVKARGGRVIVACPKELIGILGTCAGIDELYSEDDSPIRCDTHAALGSLPRIFQTNLDTIPAGVPFLSAPPELVEYWRKELPADGRLRVGIHWQGNPKFRGDRRRSMPLAEFAPLARVEDLRLVSLQKGFGSEQLTGAPFEVEDLGSRLATFCDTAAVIKNLDLVVTSDSAVAHLTGALGAGGWVVLPRVPDWRWLLDRNDCPWYPTMRLFRQQSLGRWSDVFESIAHSLRELVAAAAESRGDPPVPDPSYGRS